MTDIVEISLDNGKYKIIHSNAEFKALRYDEPWRDLTGDNLILFLVFEVESLRQQLVVAEEKAKHWEDTCHSQWENYEQQLAEAVKMLSEQDYEYNRKTNAIIERHTKQLAECQAWEHKYRGDIASYIAMEQGEDAAANYLASQQYDHTILDTLLKQALEDETQNQWKRVIIDGLVVCHILNKEHETDPQKALNSLIAWSSDVALDPQVSSNAAALKKQWQREALLEALIELQENMTPGNSCYGEAYYDAQNSLCDDLRRKAEELK